MRLLDPDLVNWSADGFGTHCTCKTREGLSLIGKMFLWRRSMVNILCYVRQLRLFLMFSFFAWTLLFFIRCQQSFLMKKTFRLLAMCRMRMQYTLQPLSCHLRFSTNESCPVRVSSYVRHKGRRHFVKELD